MPGYHRAPERDGRATGESGSSLGRGPCSALDDAGLRRWLPSVLWLFIPSPSPARAEHFSVLSVIL